MILRLFASLWGFSIAFLSPSANAQVPSDVRSRLAVESVVSDERHVYARGTTGLRGTAETAEQRAVLDALRLIVNKLCKYEPRSDRRLEAGVTGASLIESIRVQRTLEVVVRVPLQNPRCKVVEIVRSAERLNSDSGKDLAASDSKSDATPQTRLLDSSYQRSGDITTRVLGGEY
jgi:hypothetical protein